MERQTDGCRILCAGFNAHHQLSKEPGVQIRAFTPLALPDLPSGAAEPVSIAFAGWSTTVLQVAGTLWSQGHQQPSNFISTAGWPQSAFGDHDGMIGYLDHQGWLYVVKDDEDREEPFKALGNETSPLLSHVALAGNERVAVTFKQAPNGRLCHVAEFENVQSLLAWYQDPSDECSRPAQHHMLPGRPKQLLANTATFLLLMEDGEVYSWGDSRYQSLGRPIVGEGAMPADKPAIIEALGGLKVSKIASGGWLSAALSEDQALYLWGSASAPGSEQSIRCLRDSEPGEIVLVSIAGADGEPSDVLDVAVGDAHVAVVVSGPQKQRLYVVGNNRDSQLGIGSEKPFIEDWTEANISESVQQVVCGPKSTFVFTDAPKDMALNS